MEKKSKEKLEDLQDNLIKLHKKLRSEKNAEWDRILPFDELLFDRWEKAKFVNAKKNASIYHNSYIAGDVKIGKNTWIGPMTVLDGSGGTLKIGNYCSISNGVMIYTHNTVNWALSGGKIEKETKSTTIGNNCYIGPYAVINKDVKIGNCCVIGALSYVNSNIPSNSIAVGCPAKVIGKIKIKGKKISYDYFEK